MNINHSRKITKLTTTIFIRKRMKQMCRSANSQNRRAIFIIRKLRKSYLQYNKKTSKTGIFLLVTDLRPWWICLSLLDSQTFQTRNRCLLKRCLPPANILVQVFRRYCEKCAGSSSYLFQIPYSSGPVIRSNTGYPAGIFESCDGNPRSYLKVNSTLNF